MDREVGRERKKIIEICAGIFEVDRQRFAVLGSRDIEFSVGIDKVAFLVHLRHLGIALDRRKHIAVVGSRQRVRRAVPGINEIVRVERVAVRPFQVVLQRDGVGQAVLRHLDVLRKVVDLLALRVVGHQARKSVDRKDRAVNRRVERRVQLIRLRGQISAQRIGAVLQLREHKILVAERRSIYIRQVILLQINIRIEEQRHQRAGLHQHIFRLMHQLGTLRGIRAGADLIDQRVVLRPAVDRIDRILIDSRTGLIRAALVGRGAFGRRVRAGCRARVSASRKTNTHGQDKQKRNQLFHVTYLQKFSAFRLMN